MKMPWTRTNSPEVSDAVLAERVKTEESFRALQETREKTPEIQELSDRMVALHRRNHFGESLTLAMRKRSTTA